MDFVSILGGFILGIGGVFFIGIALMVISEKRQEKERQELWKQEKIKQAILSEVLDVISRAYLSIYAFNEASERLAGQFDDKLNTAVVALKKDIDLSNLVVVDKKEVK